MTYRIVLVGCGQSKIVTSGEVEARDLYVSNYFDLKRRYAERADLGAVLSAKYGAVPLEGSVVETYDLTIDDVDAETWALRDVVPLVETSAAYARARGEEAVVEVLAGRAYVDPLRDLLEAIPVEPRYPFDDTSGIGEQMGWLSSELEEATA